MHEKVIFIDVDGALNTRYDRSSYGIYYICPKKVSLLNIIVRETGSKIVYSTTWRLHKDTKFILDQALASAGILTSVIGQTPSVFSGRSHEIRLWLSENPTNKFVIIDDLEEANVDRPNTFFQTSDQIGLTHEIALKIIEVLNKDDNQHL